MTQRVGDGIRRRFNAWLKVQTVAPTLWQAYKAGYLYGLYQRRGATARPTNRELLEDEDKLKLFVKRFRSNEGT